MDNDRSINLDFSPVRMLTMWLLRTSYKSYYEYTVVVLYSECDHENNQSTHICMNHTKTQKLLPIEDLEAAHLLLLLLFRRKKIIIITHSHRPKTPLVACVFYLVLICTCFWLNVNRYTCFWHLPLQET